MYVKHMALLEPYDCYTPKHHIIFHLLHRSEYAGNPKQYATWMSEAKNRTLKLCCRQVSQVNFEATVLFKMRHVLSQPAKSQKRRMG